MTNPLSEGLRLRRRPDPCVLAIFGASGDLTRRKLFPALYALAYRRLLPERFSVFGVARSEQTTAQFRAAMKQAVKDFGHDPFRQDVWDSLAKNLRYIATEFDSDAGEDSVAQMFDEFDEGDGT
jgi:glucose-6-phosphate 1-dehydrogenase